MILDTLVNSQQYWSLHPRFEEAFRFVIQHGATLPLGRNDIDGDNLFVIISEPELIAAADARLEAHEQYIDIQAIIHTEETFGWRALDDCHSPAAEFDTERDIIFFDDRPTALVKARAGQFVIFFPNDAHAPLIGQGQNRKAIVKILL